ncbi:TIR domain-containing protein [Kitasatospora sp. NPDC058170]|uniref:TIR domain-containing protein n=1 Tax=Kitasatospora sp. NPDC058170 TaxID=3346364 RepID=UPI0036DB6631
MTDQEAGRGGAVYGNHFGTGNIDFSTGKTVNRGGPRQAAGRTAGAPEPTGTELSRNVFVVHGRDEQVRREMFGLLRRLGLNPLEWEHLVGATGLPSPFIGEVVAHAPTVAGAALVLLTPDDVAVLHDDLRGSAEPAHERLPSGQPRQNVLIELGMVLMAYPERTVIVEFGDVRPASDLAGRNVVRFTADGNPAYALRKVAQRLEVAGCPVDDRGHDWLDTEPFRDLGAYRRRG